MSPEVAKKNAEWFARKKTKREARAVVKAGKKAKKFVQPKPEDMKVAVKEHIKQVQREAKRDPVAHTLHSLKQEIKQRWPKVKGLADAKREEMERMLNAHEGDSIVAELQETWAQRSRARHEAWIKGESESAKSAREKMSVVK